MLNDKSYKYFLRITRLFLLVLAVSVTSYGCSVTPSSAWGSKTNFSPGWDKIKKAAKDSFYETGTWLPLATSAVFALGDLDQRTVKYATKHHPVFKDEQDALNSSDDLRELAKLSMYLTTLATHSADTTTETVKAKTNGIVAQGIAIALTNNVTGFLKREVGRYRPHERGDDSFPSAHASDAAVYTHLAVQNLNNIDMSSGTKLASEITFGAISGLTAWARVEGNVHYPSDVLFGMALGNFFAKFVNKAFINGDENVLVGYQYDPYLKTPMLMVRYFF